MLGRLRLLKRLAVDLPRQARLAYCLVRDPRVPRAPKLALLTAVGVIVTPFIDLPAAVPLVGELDVLALSLVAVRLFVAACPREVVESVQTEIAEGRSVFDGDVARGERLAIALAGRLRRHEPAEEQVEAPRYAVVSAEAADRVAGAPA